MLRVLVLPLFVAALCAAAAHTQPRTMRVDYYHSGTAAGEDFSLDEVLMEGEWPGRMDRLIDDTNLGKYYFEVLDRKTNRVLYSRGFASIYGEWESTDEAKDLRRTFSESVRFPAPDAPVQLVIKKRDRQNALREVWSVVIDPAGPTVNHSAPPANVKLWAVMQNGEPRDKVDLLLMGDGYTAAEMDKWHGDAKRLTEILFSQPPFRERRNAFNVWAVDTPADESGVSGPPMAYGADRRWARVTTRSAPSATCSASTTSDCAMRLPWRPTSSSRSW